MTTCGWLTYMPVLCESLNVLKPNIQLVKQMPPEVLICDPIPINLTVKNTGSSILTDVSVTDPLPAGLTTTDGRRSIVQKIGQLAPGESRQVRATAKAAKTGTYENVATVTSAQGVKAQAKATTVVRAPVLNIACKVPEQRFAGRPTEVCLTVANRGDAPAANTVVEAAVSAGAVFQSATAGGRFENGRVVWRLGAFWRPRLPSSSARRSWSRTRGPLPSLPRLVVLVRRRSVPLAGPALPASRPFCWRSLISRIRSK